jgi:hypothetical protein
MVVLVLQKAARFPYFQQHSFSTVDSTQVTTNAILLLQIKTVSVHCMSCYLKKKLMILANHLLFKETATL